MTEQKFESIMKKALITAYIERCGEDTWTSQSDAEKSKTLHNLLYTFMASAAESV